MSNHQGNLIDLSPPSSGYSTPNPYSTHPPTPSAPNYGFGSAVMGLWRRISTADEQHQQQQHQHQQQHHHNHQHDGSGSASPSHQYSLVSSIFASLAGDGIHGAFTPPRRQASPVGLPSLGPLSLTGYYPDTEPQQRLLNRGIAEEIRTFLPERLKISDNWRLVYSLYQNGSSLGTLYKLCDEFRGRRVGFVLVVRDSTDSTFGAYLTDTPHPQHSYYGTGECFLWRAELHAALPPPPSADTSALDDHFRVTTIATSEQYDINSTGGGSSFLSPAPVNPMTNKAMPPPMPQTQSIRFQNFAYSGINDYCILCEAGFLSVGGGSGKYGLWLNDSLSKGRSAECETFLNQPLSEEGEKFDIIGVELWVVGAT